MAGLVDERMAAASGSRIDKVFRQARALAKKEASQLNADNHSSELLRRQESLKKIEENAKRLSLPETEKKPSLSLLPAGTLAYIIILLILVCCIFGLEVYRIRETNRLNHKLNFLEGELESIRLEFTESLKNLHPIAITESYTNKQTDEESRLKATGNYSRIEINKRAVGSRRKKRHGTRSPIDTKYHL